MSRTFKLVQDGLSPSWFTATVLSLTVAVLILAAVPAFRNETHGRGSLPLALLARAPETREQNYLETLIAREDTPRRFSSTN